MDKAKKQSVKRSRLLSSVKAADQSLRKQVHGTKDHEGNLLLNDPKVQQQLKLHKDALDR
jgi:hypothetical protein